MENLLHETLRSLLETEHTIEDIVFIGTNNGEYGCTWDEFRQMADRCYDGYYGEIGVDRRLVIVFRDHTFLWRTTCDHDGPEGWEYITPPHVPAAHKPLTSVFYHRSK